MSLFFKLNLGSFFILKNIVGSIYPRSFQTHERNKLCLSATTIRRRCRRSMPPFSSRISAHFHSKKPIVGSSKSVKKRFPTHFPQTFNALTVDILRYVICQGTGCVLLLRDMLLADQPGRIANERIANETNCKLTLCIYIYI